MIRLAHWLSDGFAIGGAALLHWPCNGARFLATNAAARAAPDCSGPYYPTVISWNSLPQRGAAVWDISTASTILEFGDIKGDAWWAFLIR